MKKIIFITICLTILTQLNAAMSQEKFMQFKKMAPPVIKIINDSTTKLNKCFQAEMSLNHMNSCLTQSKMSIEKILMKLVPKQIPTLCKPNAKGEWSFTWTEQRQKQIIHALEARVSRSIQEGTCLEKAKSVKEFATCIKSLH